MFTPVVKKNKNKIKYNNNNNKKKLPKKIETNVNLKSSKNTIRGIET